MSHGTDIERDEQGRQPNDSPAGHQTEDPAEDEASNDRHSVSHFTTSDDSDRTIAEGSEHQSVERNTETEDVVRRVKERRDFGDTKPAEDRHHGIIWRNVTVKGVGKDNSLQWTNTDVLLSIPRLFWNGLTFWRWKQKRREQSAVWNILTDFTGFVKPGEMLLVLGRPGAGCSTFLKILGNERRGYESVEGSVTYGGTDSDVMEKHFHSEVLYCPEEDFHEATLTVRQTLAFALDTRVKNSTARKHNERPSKYRKAFLQDIAKLFWIEGALDTKLGNNLIRGVSGGEKRRASIAEAMIAGASIQCWDNSTRGLDASTALQYVQSLRSISDKFGASNVVMLYQASENLYQQFDKVLLIEGGKCAYFGPSSEAKAYFEGLGFECPPRWTTADFMTSVSDVNARNVREEWHDRIPQSPEDFHNAYMQSSIREQTMQQLAEFEREMDTTASTRDEKFRDARKRNYTISFVSQIFVLSKRQLLILVQNQTNLAGKYGVVLFLALIIGSMFYNLPDNSQGLFTRGGVLYFIILFNTLLAMAELSASFEVRPVIQKHKNFSFYRPAAFALAQVVADVPLVFIQVTIFNIIVYFLSHLARDAGKFWLNFMLSFCITMTVYAFFRCVGSMSASLDVATRITGLSMQAMITYTGYLIHPSSMKPWLKWLIWINPVQYSFEAILSNEMHHSLFACAPQSIFPQGPSAAANHQGCLVTGSRPNSLVVNGDMYAKTNFTYERRHLWRNFGIVISFYVLFVVISLYGFEKQRPTFGGKTVTVFKHGESPSQEKSFSPDDHHEEKKPTTNEVARSTSNVVVNEEWNQSPWCNLNEDTNTNQMVTFTWRNVHYSVPTKSGAKPLLQNVQGYVRPGRLTALIGASGSGKTTLLNALAQRLTYGTLSGDFLIDGKPLPRSFGRDTGFAAQADIHEPTLSIRESLRFSALLRQPRNVPIKEKYAHCEEVLDILELKPIAGAIIGHEGSGLNQEQRKRVTIAVELASKPKMLFFLDEPTSGLDSLGAFNIVRLLRKLADSGQSVLCTIHQPSAVLFEQFDELLLLKAGGRLVYHGELGPDFKTLVKYFERNGGKEIGPNANPAEWMLEVIGAGNPSYQGQDWADVWERSAEHQQRSEEIENIIQSKKDEASGFQGMYENDTYAMPIWVQIPVVTKRAFISYWRTPNYALGKFILQSACGLFNTFTFWELNQSTTDMQSRVFSVFMMLVIGPPLIQQLQPQYLHFRKLYEERESQSRIYSWVAVAASCTVVEIPYAMVSGTFYFCCWYFGTWFSHNSFSVGISWIYMMLYACYYTGVGQFIAAMSPNELVASMLVPAIFTFVLSFSGVVMPYSSLPTFWRRWMYWLTPVHYLVEGYVGVVTNRVPVRCKPEEFTYFTPPPGSTCQGYAGDSASKAGGYLGPYTNGMCSYCPYTNGNQWAKTLNIEYGHKWRNFVIVISYVIFNFLVVYLFTWLYLHGVPDLKRSINQSKMKMSSWFAKRRAARNDIEHQ